MPSLEDLIKEVSANVYTKIGPYHREFIYRRALVSELQYKNLFVEEEVNVPIPYNIDGRRLILGNERADIIVNQSCILELKVGNPRPATVEAAIGQAKRYLRFYSTPSAKIAYVIFFGDKIHCYEVSHEAFASSS